MDTPLRAHFSILFQQRHALIFKADTDSIADSAPRRAFADAGRGPHFVFFQGNAGRCTFAISGNARRHIRQRTPLRSQGSTGHRITLRLRGGGVPIAPPRGTRPFDGRFGNVGAGPAGPADSAGGSAPTCSRFWSPGPVLRSIPLSARPSRRCSRRPLGAWPNRRPGAG